MPQSTIEDEYIVAASAANQKIWLTRILEDLGDEQLLPLKILCDNKFVIAITKNFVFHNRTKYIAIKYHCPREFEANGEIHLKYFRLTSKT